MKAIYHFLLREASVSYSLNKIITDENGIKRLVNEDTSDDFAEIIGLEKPVKTSHHIKDMNFKSLATKDWFNILVDKLLEHRVEEDTAYFSMEKGRWFDIKVFYYNNNYILILLKESFKKDRGLSGEYAHFKSLFDVSLDMLLFMDTKGFLFDFNQAFRDFFSNDNTKNNLSLFVHPEDMEKYRSMLNNIHQGVISHSFIARFKSVSGEYKHLEWRFKLDNNMVYASARDISFSMEYAEELRQSIDKYKLLFENSPVGILYYNTKGIIRECNDNFVKIIGSLKEKLIGLDMYSLPDKRILEALDTVLVEQKSYTMELVYKSYLSDKVTPVRILFAPVKINNYEVIGGLGIVEDITERLEYEEALKKSYEKYRHLFDYAVNGILIGDRFGKIIDVNKQMINMSGYSKDELLGSDIKILFSEDVLVEKPLNYEAVLAGEIIVNERELKRKQGSTIFVEMTTHQIEDGRLQSYMRDITEKKNAEEDIKKLQADLKITLDSLVEGVISVDKNSRIKIMNPAAEKLLGVTFEDVSDKDINQFMTIIDIKTGDIISSPVEEVISREQFFLSENRGILINSKNNKIHIEYTYSPLIDVNLNTTGVVFVFRDITEHFLLKEKIVQFEKMETIGLLTGGIAHDFNNMLSGIFGGIELLKSVVKTSDGKIYINMIFDAATRAADLASRLLLFGRKSNSDFEFVDIKEAVLNTITILKYSIDRKIKIGCHLCQDDIFIKGNLTEIQNMLMNLGINSAHAMPEGGDLNFTISCVNASDYSLCKKIYESGCEKSVIIKVHDTGCGIPEKYRDKIFEPFFTSKEKGKGTGLGLSSILSTVNVYGGVIDFESSDGEGTTFFVCFPTVDFKSEKVNNDKVDHIFSGSVLIVDDESIIRDSTGIMLEELGFSVLKAENGKEGYRLYFENSEDIKIVLMDMIMPEMNGKECFFKIRERNPDASIILCSGFIKENDLEEMEQHGLDGFIKKPFRLKELVSVLRSVLK